MSSKSQPQKEQGSILPALTTIIEVLGRTKETSNITPAKDVFGLVGAFLTIVKNSAVNEQDYVDLALFCADVCKALEGGLDGKQLDELSGSVLGAIEQLKTTVTVIQKKFVKHGKRNALSRAFHAKGDKEKVLAWRQDLTGILQILITDLAINTDPPPPPPRPHFGREGMIEQVVGLAKYLTPIALIGAGGIGKTSIALTVLHDDRIRERFGHNRRFIRCDQFPASPLHFLARLSKVIGAAVEYPEDLRPLQPLLSSQDMLIVLDNAESILDPQGADAQEMYTLVDQLCQLKTLCIFITSRTTKVPEYYKRPQMPTLSMEAARDIFYNIYRNREESAILNHLLQRLGFHALSITLLAAVASHDTWDFEALAKEWDIHRAQLLPTAVTGGLATTLELSLASPTFHKLGPDARGLLGVVAFFPQGVDERNLDWLFPTIPNAKNILDKSCVLSLMYRSNGFVTMLAPIRDYLRPKDPQLSPLLCAVRDCYSTRLLVDAGPDIPGFAETGWIISEDLNAEHLLDVFTSISAEPVDIWDVVRHFIKHLYWHKPRQIMLGSKIEALPNTHPSKPDCLSELSQLVERAGNREEGKRLSALAGEVRGAQRGEIYMTNALNWIKMVVDTTP